MDETISDYNQANAEREAELLAVAASVAVLDDDSSTRDAAQHIVEEKIDNGKLITAPLLMRVARMAIRSKKWDARFRAFRILDAMINRRVRPINARLKAAVEKSAANDPEQVVRCVAHEVCRTICRQGEARRPVLRPGNSARKKRLRRR